MIHKINKVWLILPLALLLCMPADLLAARGDTTKVNVFDKYLWTYYGSQNRWGKFPGKDKKHERVIMHFRLTCPTGGCGEWDYTMRVYARTRTGVIDSTLTDAPAFRIGGEARDTAYISLTPTIKTRYNATKKTTDTVVNQPFIIVFYRDNARPFTPTDSQSVYEAGYWNYLFSSTGAKADSFFVAAGQTLTKGSRKAYQPFEVIRETEIARFITPYGKWFPKDWTYSWDYDITDYDFLLKDSTEIRVLYDGYSQGSLFSLDFDMIEGIPARETYRVDVLYSGNPTYGDPNNPIEDFLSARRVPPPASKQDISTLRLITTGHGFGGTENAAEFSDKTHSVAINGQDLYQQHLWRPDCGQNPVYPQAGTWYFQRGGWCPGDAVQYWDYNLSSHFNGTDSVTVDYNMEPYTNANLSQRASYIIEGQMMYSKANYKNNASLEEIRTPNSAYKYRRMNPICPGQQPVVVIRNNGIDNLRSLDLTYSIDNGPVSVYNWKGDLPYMQTAEIALPSILFSSGDHTFTVGIAQPNGQTDESSIGDMQTVKFTTGRIITTNRVILTLMTDYVEGIPNSIRYEFTDAQGNVLHAKGEFKDRTLYRDTVELPDGCHRFIIYEEGIGDGLFPIYQGSSRGYFNLRDGKNAVFYNTQSTLFGQPAGVYASFGDREIITFQVNAGAASAENDNTISTAALQIIPNPVSSTMAIVQAQGLNNQFPVQIGVYSMLGTLVQQYSTDAGGATALPLDLSALPIGNYMVRLINGNITLSTMVLRSGN
jgi:hypothetical protein